MPRLIELIRQSAVPAGVIRTAAKGELSLPPAEMVEVLVYLAEHSSNVKEDAQNTLARWTDEALTPVLADPKTPREVLNYFLDPRNLRPTLLRALLKNPSLTSEQAAHIRADLMRLGAPTVDHKAD